MCTEDNLFLNELILELAGNNKDALNEIFRLMGARMKGVALRCLKNKNYADDVVSEAFFKIVKKADTFKKGTNGIGWICQIVRNTAYDYNKMDIKYPKIRFDLVDNYLPAEESGVKDDFAYLEEALKKLSSIEFKVITLHYWDYMSLAEIAKEIKKNKIRYF